MKNRAILSVGLSLALAAGATPTRPWTAEETAYVDRLLTPVLSRPLSTSYRFPDGAMGVTFGPTIHDGPHAPELHPEYRSREEQMLQEDLCWQQGVVLARAHEPLAWLNPARTMIHSKTDFDIVEVVKGGGSLQPGDLTTVARRGGEVQLGDERLRVIDQGATPYVDGELYLLLLRRIEPTAPMLSAQQFNVAVRDDRVWPEKQRWYSISSGETWADVRANLRRLLSFTCRG